MEVIHFKSQKERLAYLKGDMEEIVLKEVTVPEDEENASKEPTNASETTPNSKGRKGKKKDGEAKAE